MWITTVTYNMAAVRAMTEIEKTSIFQTTVDKIRELRSNPSAGGSTVTGFEAPDFNAVSPETASVIVKRTWNTQVVAQEFVDFLNSVHSCASATLEEQV